MRRKRSMNWWQAVLLLLGVLVVNVIVEIVVSAVWIGAGLSMQKYIAGNIAIVNTLSIGICVYLGLRWTRRSFRELLPHRVPSIILIAGSILLAFGANILISEIDNFVRQFIQIPSFMEGFEEYLVGDQKIIGLTLLALTVVAPITEEYLFRGVILGSFLKKYRVPTAIFLSALFFSLFHLNPAQLLGAFIAGLLLGWIFVKTRSLVPCLIIHAVFNGMYSLFTDFLRIPVPGFNVVNPSSPFQPLWFDGMALAVFALGLWLIIKFVPTAQPLEDEEEILEGESADLEPVDGVKKSHSMAGMISLGGAAVVIVGMIAIFVWLFTVIGPIKAGQLPDEKTLMAVGIGFLLCLFILLGGVGFSIYGLVQKNRYKLFSVLGLVVNSLFFMLFLLVVVAGIALSNHTGGFIQ